MADNLRNSSLPAPLEGLNAWSEMEKDYLTTSHPVCHWLKERWSTELMTTTGQET